MAQNKLDIKAEAKNLNFFYADGTKALKNVSLPYSIDWSLRLRKINFLALF
jgi:hypothetical protein